MKKILSASLAVALCVGALTACENKEENSSSLAGKKDSVPSIDGSFSGDYCPIYRPGGKRSIMRDDIDTGMKDTFNYIEEAEADGVETTGYMKLSFSGNKFISDGVNLRMGWDYYDGIYSIEDEKIHFKYENRKNTYDDTVINIDVNDDCDIDEGAIKAVVERMQSMNESGTYCKDIAPALAYSDKFLNYNVEPYFINNRSYDQKNPDYPVYLIPKGDFLCVETYGFDLNGKYKSGSDFKINFNQYDSLIEDPGSRYNIYKNVENDESKAAEYLGKLETWCEPQLVNGDFDTTIEFSDGEWNWYNADGELINNGEYQESKDYKGLISMYITDDSKNYDKYVEPMDPLLFYIADDGEIYYPAYVKMN